MKKINVFATVLLLSSIQVYSQISGSESDTTGTTVGEGRYFPDPSVPDRPWVAEVIPTKRVIAHPYLREADVMWAKRIWQVIDLREKMNHPLYFPIERIADRKSLFDCIKDALLVEGSISAYGLGPTGDNDEFVYQLSQTELDSLLNPIQYETVLILETGEPDIVPVNKPVESISITQYQIKEDWLFDKQRSERYVRIIGICPMMEDYDDNGLKRGMKPLFWIYFPELRYVLANQAAFNRSNDAQRMTFDELFEKRMFSSFVVKEANVYNRYISDYARNIDALIESEEIKNDLFIMEHDLWQY
jgi:gliding motility associated protien GldN